MMYIEQTPLGGNLQSLLRNKEPSNSTSSAASILLAHVRLAGEALRNEGSGEERGAVATQQIGKTENINCEGNNNNIPNIREELKFLDQDNLTPEAEEFEDNYELIDVVYSAEELRQQECEDWKEETLNQNETPKDDSDFGGGEVTFEIEYGANDSEYIIKPIQQRTQQPLLSSRRGYERRQPSPPTSPPRTQRKLAHALNPYQDNSLTNRKRSYYEAGIGAEFETGEEHVEGPSRKFYSRDGVGRVARQSVRLLNGRLLSTSRASVHSVTSSAGYTYVGDKDGYFVPNYESYYEDTEESEVEESPEDHLNALIEKRTSQMGVDIFTKLCQLLRFNSANRNTNNTFETQVEGKRKRRSGNNWPPTDAVNPQQIKYRKVHNRFPKYVARSDEDDLELIGTYPSNKHHHQQHYLKPNWNAIDMSHRRSSNSFGKHKVQLRKSMFSAPQMRKKLVQNTSYADVEFSDDDEPELIRGFGMGNNNDGDGPSGSKQPQIFNIPISRSTERRITPSAKLTSPPRETLAYSILSASLMPERQNPKKLSYADAVRQNMPTAGGHVLGKRSGQISSSSSSVIGSSRNDNGMESHGRTGGIWATNAQSILTQQKLQEEREQYRLLLQQVVPKLYGGEKVEQHNGGSQRRRSAQSVGLSNTLVGNTLANLTQKSELQYSFKHPPLSSTINLDEYEVDYCDADVTITGVTEMQGRQSSLKNRPATADVIIDDDDDDEISEIVDLDEACAKLRVRDARDKQQKPPIELPYVTPVNSLQDRLDMMPHLKTNWLENLKQKWLDKKILRDQEVKETEEEAAKLSAERRAAEVDIRKRLREFQIVDPELVIVDEFPESEEEEEEEEDEPEEESEIIELTAEHHAVIKSAVCGSPDDVLVSKFNLNITRRDIHTLLGNNWLNDEVINFYMNLLSDRGENLHESHGMPRVYAMNTFFVPRLMQAGHSGVKRWTRKVNIFEKDIIPVPVHVGGVHWCMAIIHLSNRTIKYYDSMGTPNPNVLRALEQYLRDESLDKRKQPYDTRDFLIESVQEVPRQMNGSDCGVFSCMFAEYVTRNQEITFTQENMEYFRQKMIYEIVNGELLQ